LGEDDGDVRFKRWLVCFRRAVWGAYEHGALGYAKGAAYSGLLAFLPVLTTVTTILIQANAAVVSRRIVRFLYEVAPPGVEDVVRYAMAERGARPLTVPVAASLLAIWAASGVTISLMEGFQAAYRRPHSRGVVRQRLLAAWLVMASILPFVGATGLMIFGDRAETWVLRAVGVLGAGDVLRGWVRPISLVGRYLLAYAAIVATTGAMYYFGPDAGRDRRIWQGAMLAGLLWLLLTLGFGWYVKHIANYNLLYGSIGAVIALILWMYLLSLSAMVGCEFNAQLDSHRRL
jgi:membrane protein